MHLDEKKYPEFLRKAYFYKTGVKLNLKHPKTINEKIQWLKIYDNIPIKTQLTDKVLVRNWIKDKIGDEYLKPALQICDSFDEIDFDKLPESFIIKCNHGCKWHIIVKKKDAYLKHERLYNYTKMQIDNWLSQSFFGYSDFETQYKNIIPRIIIEPLLRENVNSANGENEIQVFCFNSQPKIFHSYKFNEEQNKRVYNTFDENYNPVNIFGQAYSNHPDNLLKKAAELSKVLAKGFKFVRIDWFIFKDKLYFEEMTFTPTSGYFNLPNKDMYIKLGNMLNLKGIEYER